MNEKTEKIRSVFSKIPGYYDIMNDAMSVGLHRLWKRRLIDNVNIINNGFYLDLSTGSGDIAKLILNKTKFFNINLTCADPDADMLEKARIKLCNYKVDFVQTAAEQMPFNDNYFDIITLSFGLRNFSSIEQGIKEIYRVIKTGGKFYCLEFSPEVNIKCVQTFYNFYLDFIPKIGKIVAKDEESYQYLSDSIRNFPNTKTIVNIMQDIGFKNVDVIFLSAGICNIYIGNK